MKVSALLRWPLYFLAWTLGITALGVIVGAVVYPIIGLAFSLDYTLRELVLNGIKAIGFYFGIWAPGIALVMTVKKAYETNKARTETAPDPATKR